jgi:hypothetical protein
VQTSSDPFFRSQKSSKRESNARDRRSSTAAEEETPSSDKDATEAILEASAKGGEDIEGKDSETEAERGTGPERGRGQRGIGEEEEEADTGSELDTGTSLDCINKSCAARFAGA